MEKNDLRIEFRAVRSFGDCHILQYRFSPGQDLTYEVEKNWFGGLLRFKLQKKYSTEWDSPLYFTGSFVEFCYNNEKNWTCIYLDKRSELDEYKRNYKTYGQLKEYLDQLSKKYMYEWSEKKSDWY